MKKYRVILVREGVENIRQFSLGNLLIFSFVLLIIGAVVSISLLFTDYYSHQEYSGKLIELQKDNARLVDQIGLQDAKIEKYVSRLDTIITQDKKIRDMIRMPQIHDDIRKVGVGGNTHKKDESNLDYLFPLDLQHPDINKFENKVNFYNRLANLEFMSYSEITQLIESDVNRYRCFPAIHPVHLSEAKKSSGFGYRRDPFMYKEKFHLGQDFSAKRGTSVYATADGVVAQSKVYGTFGNYVEIDHGYGYKTIYGHMNRRVVKKGEQVIRGQKIGTVGTTGRSTAPHLHYEVHHQNKEIDPDDFYFDEYSR